MGENSYSLVETHFCEARLEYMETTNASEEMHTFTLDKHKWKCHQSEIVHVIHVGVLIHLQNCKWVG